MKVIGMGDNVVDRYVNKKIMYPGGNAVNFAVYAKQCGVDASYLGVFADDVQGHLIRNSLLELGIDVSACTMLKECSTERCDVNLVEGDRIFVGCCLEEGKDHRSLTLGEKELEYLKSFDVIHCGCYAEMENEIKKIKDFSAIKTFDFSSEDIYREKDYLEKICPYIDMALFSAESMNDKQVKELLEKVYKMGTSYVLITKGVDGQVLYDGKGYYKGTVKLISPVDTMGAGDSFFTSFVMELLKNGWIKEEALKKEIIARAFNHAADFSAKTCLIEGAYGFGTIYE